MGRRRLSGILTCFPQKDGLVLLYTLIDIVSYLMWIVQVLVIAQFLMSLAISFNVINLHNDFVASIWRAINALLDPLLRPIRKLMPETGAIDFSPMVLIIILVVLQKVLYGLAMSSIS